jgi:hypothetical protein
MHIHETFSTSLDRLNIRNKVSDKKFFNYSKYLIKKPWGEEFLIFQTKKIAVWVLKINSKQKTSLHCHCHKKTILIPISGKFNVNLLLKKYITKKEPIILNKNVFHQTYNNSNKKRYLIEIETPNLKNDIIRYRDYYGRSQNNFKSESLNNSENNIYISKKIKKKIYIFDKKKILLIEVNVKELKKLYDNYKKLNYFIILKKINKKFKEGDIFFFNKKNLEILENSLGKKISLLLI